MGKYHRYVGGKVGFSVASVPDSRNCRKCGLPVAFKKLASGKFCPTNVDGSDHFDICRLTQFKNSKRDVCVGMTTTMTVPIAKLEFYAGDVPPWDESLDDGFQWPESRGYKIVRDPRAYRKFVNPSELIEKLS